MQVTQKKYDEMVAIAETIKAGCVKYYHTRTIAWEDIFEIVSINHKIRKGGWMTVRNAMHNFLIIPGFMERTENLSVEEYKILNLKA